LKICVLVNSFCIALGMGWDELRVFYPEISMSIFFSPGRSILNTEIRGSKIVPTDKRVLEYFQQSSSWQGEIDVAEFDRFLVYGLHPVPPSIQNDRAFSRAVRLAAYKERVKTCPVLPFIERLRSVTDAPIDFMMNPYPALPADCDPVPVVEFLREDIEVTTQLWNELLNVRFVPQPEETLIEGNRATKLEFAKGKYSKPDDPDAPPMIDLRHMNAAFGKVSVARYLDGLAGLV